MYWRNQNRYCIINVSMKRIPLSKLHPAEWNPRTLKEDRFKNLCKSIENDPEFMELRPILATKSGEIYGGNMRYRAVQHLGWKDVPAVLSDIPEKLAKERAVKDNSQFGEWDDSLATLIDELEKDGIDLEQLGLDANIQKMIDKLQEKEIVEDEAPPVPKEPKAKLGDLYQLGEHRLLCGDATKVEDVERLMDGEKADMVFTSPPYGAANSAKLRDHYVRGMEKRKSFYESHKDEIGSWYDLMCGWFSCARAVSDCVLCNVQMLADNKIDLLQWIYDRRDDVVDIVIWDKGNGAPQMQKNILNNDYEMVIVFGGNGSRTIPMGDFHGNFGNIVRIVSKGKNEFSNIHAAVFPIEFPVWAIRDLCGKSKSVYDPFGGTGTTLIACEQLNRKCYMMELDPKYIDVIIQRWENLTGKKAKKL